MKKILLILISLSAQASDIKWSCINNSFSEKIEIQIFHSLKDFSKEQKSIKSYAKVILGTKVFNFKETKLDLNSGTIEFKSNKALPLIKNSSYTLKKFYLYDRYPEIEQDDFFFGQLESTKEQALMITDYTNFGGPLVRIFDCTKTY